MIRKINSALLSILMVFLCLLLPAQGKTLFENPITDSYDQLLSIVKKGDLSIDFRALRFAFADTKNYSVYGSDKETRNKMFETYGNSNYKEALRLAEIALERNYVDMNFHFIAFAAHKELGNTEKAEFHRKIVNKLLDSIQRGNDGKSTATSFEVIVVDEEYTMLRFLGYEVTKNQLVRENGHAYDLMTVVNAKTKETTQFYFNVDKPFEMYEKLLNP